MQQYICYNGYYHKAEEPVLPHDNRGFLYGDALFETMRANGKVIHFFNDHISRLYHSMKTLGMDVPEKIRTAAINEDIVKLLNKNRHLKGARIRLTVFRNSGGKYTPQTNEVSYLISSEKLPSDIYQLNDEGLVIDIFQQYKKPLNLLSNLKTTNDLIYILAGLFKKEQRLNECILLNENNELVEAISSNLFLVKENILKTPPLKSGCLNGIMRKQILELAEDVGLKISMEQKITPQELLESDEIFLTNAVHGIQWVKGFRNIRYYKSTAKKLIQRLNEITQIDQ
jgi:branched-chain amino acid aminotransferase